MKEQIYIVDVKEDVKRDMSGCLDFLDDYDEEKIEDMISRSPIHRYFRVYNEN